MAPLFSRNRFGFCQTPECGSDECMVGRLLTNVNGQEPNPERSGAARDGGPNLRERNSPAWAAYKGVKLIVVQMSCCDDLAGGRGLCA